MTKHIDKSPPVEDGGSKVHPNEQRIVWDMYFSSSMSGLLSNREMNNVDVRSVASLADAMWAVRCERFK
ncbi:hypothetical protein EBZ39_19300 [bacterium]|nr:hypothetical protein [bacterium]